MMEVESNRITVSPRDANAVILVTDTPQLTPEMELALLVTSPAASTEVKSYDSQGATSKVLGEPVRSAGEAFSITAVGGWLDVTSQVEQEVEIALRDDEMSDEFFTNLVVASEDPIGDLEQSIEAAAEQVAGATDGGYELIDSMEIDGEEAFGFLLTRTTTGVEVAQTQWWVEHDDRLYVATFSSAKTQQEAQRPVMEQLLSSWSWAD